MCSLIGQPSCCALSATEAMGCKHQTAKFHLQHEVQIIEDWIQYYFHCRIYSYIYNPALVKLTSTSLLWVCPVLCGGLFLMDYAMVGSSLVWFYSGRWIRSVSSSNVEYSPVTPSPAHSSPFIPRPRGETWPLRFVYMLSSDIEVIFLLKCGFE